MAELFDTDWRKDPLALAKVFLNCMNNIRFNDYLTHLVAFRSIGINEVGCNFEHDSEDDDPFEGVQIYCGDERLVIELEAFRSLLIQAAETRAARYPKDAAETLRLIEGFQTKEYRSPYLKP